MVALCGGYTAGRPYQQGAEAFAGPTLDQIADAVSAKLPL